MSTFLAFCEAELPQENYFHAVFEKHEERRRPPAEMTGIHGDGDEAC